MIKPLRFDVTQRYARAYDQNGTMLGYVMSVGDAGEHAMLDSAEPSDLDAAREEMILDATRARIKLSRMLARDVTLSRRRKVRGHCPDITLGDVADSIIRWHSDVPYMLFPEGVEIEIPSKYLAPAAGKWDHPVFGPGELSSAETVDGITRAIWRPVMGHISLASLIEQGKFEVVEI